MLVAILTVVPMLYEFQRVTDQVSHDMAQLHATELVGDLEARIGREIALVQKMSATRTIIDWMASPDDPDKRRAAFDEFTDYNALLTDHNSFVAVASTRGMYFPGEGAAAQDLIPSGYLDERVEGDAWYFETIRSNIPLLLNIDVDRFLGSMRIWVNMTVRRDGRILGVLGTGLNLTPFLNTFFAQHEAIGAESIIFNRFGDIQLAATLDDIRQNSFDAGSTEQSIFRYGADEDFRETVNAYLGNRQLMTVPVRAGRFRYMALAPISNTDWSVATFFSPRSLFDSRRLLPLLGLLVAGLAAVTFLVGILMRRFFVTPFARLTNSIQNQDAPRGLAVIEGDNRADEFGVLARAIRQMTDRWVRAIPVGIFLIDNNGVFLYANPSMCGKLGVQTVEELNRIADGLFLQEGMREEFVRRLAGTGSLVVIEAEIQGKDGSFWADLRLQRVSGSAETTQWEGVMLDIQEKKDRERVLQDEASTDALTGLPNRKWFQRRLDEEISRSDRYGGHPALVLFDLDHFKRVNDLYGHDAGDRVLVSVAAAAQACIRRSDHVVRWGGEEFVVLIPDGSEASAWIVAEKIRLHLASLAHPGIGAVTASFGTALRLSGESAAEWFRRADQALYRAKREGRNRVVRADDPEQRALPSQTVLQLVWQQNLACGNPVIDRQHQTLFLLANELADAISIGAGAETITRCYDGLLAHFRQHAQDEEAILLSTAWDRQHIDRHQDLHHHLLDAMAEWRDRVTDPASDHAGLLLELVNAVVFQHLMQEDLQYFPFVR